MYVLTIYYIYYHSTDKGLHCTKHEKEILNCAEKYRVLRTYCTHLVISHFGSKIKITVLVLTFSDQFPLIKLWGVIKQNVSYGNIPH